MTTLVKVFKPLLLLAVAAVSFSCNENTPPSNDSEMADSVAPQSTATDTSTAFKPFDIVEIQHEVKDYKKWKAVFDADTTARFTNGLHDMIVAKSTDNPNNILLILGVKDMQRAKAFVEDPKLKETMGKGGVMSKPRVEYFHVIRLDTNAKEKTWVQITHKVKDFDAWLKVYDEEGSSKRAGEGLYDAALARGADDPNLVQIIFDVKDTDKAKAALASEEKKKLMRSAGVEGVPAIEFFKD